MSELTTKQIHWALAHLDTIAKHEVKSQLKNNDFDFERTLEIDGYFVIPMNDEVDFDFGDTESGGQQLKYTSPLDTINQFKINLEKDLREILATMQKES